MQMVYGGIKHTVRWWRIQDGEHVLGEIEEPTFDFFPANDVRIKVEELRQIAAYSEQLERDFYGGKRSQNRVNQNQRENRNQVQNQTREAKHTSL